jgi:acyl carrier protein
MSQSDVIHHLKEWVSKELLEGQDIGLDETTPLLEWGVINSIEIARLVSHIEDEWGISVPEEMVVLGNFENLQAIASLITKLSGGGA